MRLRHALADENIPFDMKKFSPHITIIRKADGISADKGAEMGKQNNRCVNRYLIVMVLTVLIISLCSCATGNEEVPETKEGDLLLVIDMQNAYTEEGPWTCPKMDQAAENIIKLIESESFGDIIFTRFDAPAEPVGTWCDYNEINRDVNESEYLNRIIDSLQQYTDIYPVYSKSTYSSMTIPEVKKAAQECIERGDSVVLTGVVSECCVIATAIDAVDMGCPVIYITDACAGADDEYEDAAVKIVSVVDYVQTKIMDTATYLSNS